MSKANTAVKILRGILGAPARVGRAGAHNIGNRLLNVGAKGKRVVKLPDGQLWHPKKTVLGTPAKTGLSGLISRHPLKSAIVAGALGHKLGKTDKEQE